MNTSIFYLFYLPSLFKNICFLLFFIFRIQITVANEIPLQEIANFYKNDKKTMSNSVTLLSTKKSSGNNAALILGRNCDELLSFSEKVSSLPWSDPQVKTSYVNHGCYCLERVCVVDVTDLFPSPIKEMLYRPITCNGPNCYNAVLMAIGLLRFNQIRMTSVDEIKYYLAKFCKQVPLDEKKSNDLIQMNRGAVEFSHFGIYLDFNILFSKAGPPKTSVYGLEDWTHLFNDSQFQFVVWRCDPSKMKIEETNSLKDLTNLEEKMSCLADSGLQQSKIFEEFHNIFHLLKKIKPSNEYENEIKNSINVSVDMNTDLLVNVQTKIGTKLLISIRDILKLRKKEGEEEFSSNFREKIQEGMEVQIVDDKSKSNFFTNGKWYKIISVL